MGKAILETASGEIFEVSDQQTKIPCNKVYTKVTVEDKYFAFYSKPEYAVGSRVQLVANGKHDLDCSPKSARHLPYTADCILLFASPEYCGKMKLYNTSNVDITNEFPPDTDLGVSAVINWGKDSWNLCTEKNFHGEKEKLDKGKYPTPSASGIVAGNNKIQSVERVQ